MTISRSRLVDADVTRWYHCISGCVRRAMLLSDDGSPGRKDWIDLRLVEVSRRLGVPNIPRALAKVRDRLKTDNHPVAETVEQYE